MNQSIATKIALNTFKPRPYQLALFKAIENQGIKRALAVWPRRAGKDITAFNLILRCALKSCGVYYYIFPTFSQARRVIWDSITNDGKRFLDFIPRELVSKTNQQQMKIELINGSLIQLVGSDNFDSLMGTNPRGCVFSEYALQDPRAYQFIRPILTANKGWAVFISCVAPTTLIIGRNGLRRISSLSSSREEYSDYNKDVWGLGGFHNAEQFYYGGKQQTLIITLENGFSIECTPVHPLWNGSRWIQSGDLKCGDLLPIQYGQDVWGSGLNTSTFKQRTHGACIDRFDYNNLKEDFFYLLGLIHADGNFDKNKVTITNKKDPEIKSFLHSLGFKTRFDGIHHELSSRILADFLLWCDFKHGARNKRFPSRLLECNRSQIIAFLQGLFDGDGTSNSNPKKRGTVKFTSTCESFMKDLQVVLVNFGIISSLRSEDKAPTKLVKVWSKIYNLEITGYFAHIFYREIGFRLKRKQKNWDFLPASVTEESGNIYPLDTTRYSHLPKNLVTNPSRISRRIIKKMHDKNPHPYFEELLAEKFFYSPIKEIKLSENEVYDFVIPETHSFFSNGFISHNTPRGKNNLWDLYQIAQQNKDWYCSKLSVADTQHIALEDIEKEVASGEMSQDMAYQEYYCSFDMGIEGAYYAKYLDKMRTNDQISMIPHEIGHSVHTAWDLGVRDSTVIIFFQTIGTTVRIIDYYENSKVGLEHYAQVLQEKPYKYGRHIAPHDIKVQELGSGISRLEKARSLGISFVVAPHIPIIDGIEAVRSMLSKTYIDQKHCAPLIKAIENYRQEFDAKRKVYVPRPLHNEFSHAADALRYLAVSLPKTRDGMSAQELDRNYQQAMYGSSLPYPFN